MPQASPRINDFVIKFANVNGSGSASANALFAKAILRMGVPVSPRNIFPSNIQGLPTWYEVRVSEAGYLGRRGGVDLMVAMNPQTWDRDLAEIEPGGYLFYDSTRAIPKSKFRDDIHVIGMPLTEICNREYTDARERQLFKNIIYVGALSALLDARPQRGREADRRAVQGQGEAAGAQHQGPAPGPRLRRQLPALHRHQGPARRQGRQPHLPRRQQRGRTGRGVRRRDRRGLVPDHALLIAGRGLRAPLPQVPGRPQHRQEPLRDPAGRGRAGLDRHGDRRRLERRARLHRDLRARASR